MTATCDYWTEGRQNKVLPGCTVLGRSVLPYQVNPCGDIARAQPSLGDVPAQAADYRRGTKRERESQDHHLEEWIAVYRAHERLGRG